MIASRAHHSVSANPKRSFSVAVQQVRWALGKSPLSKRKPSPRKLELHEVIAKLKARTRSPA